MKTLKHLFVKTTSLALGVILILTVSCTDNFSKINTKVTAVGSVGPAQLPFLLSQAQSNSPNSQWNYQIAQNLFSDQYAQYFACTADYFGSDRLVINQGWVGAAFNPMYSISLPALQGIFQNTDSTSAEYQIASIWWVYTFHRVTDYWGPIPYFSAGKAGSYVPYDAQDKIYADFFRRLKTATQILQPLAAENHFGDYDLVFGGDVSKWIKFANSLRLRLALRISNVDPATAKTEAEAAVAGGVMSASPGDDAFVERSTTNGDGNGLSIMEWNEFRMSASMESVLKGYQDPRLSIYYMPSMTTGDYEGVLNGLLATTLDSYLPDPKDNTKSLPAWQYASHHGAKWTPAGCGCSSAGNDGVSSYLSTPQIVMVTAESYFNMAEGALKGWNMGGATAKDLYNQGIAQSFAQWGISSGLAAYQNSTNTPVNPFGASEPNPQNLGAMTNIPIAFGSTQAVQLEQIATQKWIAMFPDGMEAWADYRRSKYLKLYPVAHSDNSLITNTATQWLRRIPFLNSEKESNLKGVQTGYQLLGGDSKDSEMTPLWWDKN